MVEYRVVVSCEHGGHIIPGPYRRLFRGQDGLLASHRGYDPGALGYARRMAARFDAPLLSVVTSRLLADPNRSPGHPRLFSRFTRPLPAAERQKILARYHTPHRERVRAAVRAALAGGATVVHIGCHSFTPVLDGQVRTMDVGLLYDPAREIEKRFCAAWQRALQAGRPDLRIRRNAPYKGTADGLPPALRGDFPQHYLGLELELNHRDYFEDKTRWRRMCDAVIDGLATVLEASSPRL